MMMIQKGNESKLKIRQKQAEKEAAETDGCTFSPKTNQKLSKNFFGKDSAALQSRYASNGSSQGSGQVFTALYDKGRVKNLQR